MSKTAEGNIFSFADLDRKLSVRLDTRRSGPLPDALDGPFRDDVLEIFKTQLEEARHALHQAHLNGATGRRIVRGHAILIDGVISRLFLVLKSLCLNAGANEPIVNGGLSLVATGGYGRGEMAPHSDTDLLFLLPETKSDALNDQVEKMLYFLWDLRLEVGHAVRTIEECVEEAKKESMIQTSLLESRYIIGNPALFENYKETLFTSVLTGDEEKFLETKLDEQKQRHDRFGNSLFYLEPNLKESPGGLRDIHTFFWISKYRYRVENVKDLIGMRFITPEEYSTFLRCREFLWKVRNALHYHAGRREDRLTFNHQVAIAGELGYIDRPNARAVEQLMKSYYQVAGKVANLSEIFLLKYQEETSPTPASPPRMLEDVFIVRGDKLGVTHESAFQENPPRLMRLFELAQSEELPLHPEALRLVNRNLKLVDEEFRTDLQVNRSFLNMLDGKVAVAWVLAKMNNCGLLGRYLPEFGRIIAQTQHDLFHVFTVDEHTLLAVRGLREIRAGKLSEELPLSTKIIQHVRKPVVLYLATLFHDIAKGRGGDHSEKGADIAKRICQRLGLSENDTEMVEWLVRNHLLMSRTAFRLDTNDPQTIFNFATQVEDAERLDLLLLLTVADIRAVGPGVWNGWKATLLRKLHADSKELLDKGLFKPAKLASLVARKKEILIKMLRKITTNAEAQAYLARFYPDYFLAYDPETMFTHFQVLAPLKEEDLGFHFRVLPDMETSEVLVYTHDHPGLMAAISGALAAAGTNILTANVNTTTDGMAFDIFQVQDARGEMILEGEGKFRRIEEMIRKVLTGQVRLDAILGKKPDRRDKSDHFHVPTHVRLDNEFSDVYSILEVTTKDRIGLLSAITRELARHNLQIGNAKIATYGEMAVDVFYIKDIFGLRIFNDEKIHQITHGVKEAIDSLDGSPEEN